MCLSMSHSRYTQRRTAVVYSLLINHFFHSFQHLRDILSVSGQHEPCLISSHLLQSSFLAEEKAHHAEEAWNGKHLHNRLHAILLRLEAQNIPHPIISGHIMANNNASCLETRRLMAFAEKVQKSLGHCETLAVCSIIFYSAAVASYFNSVRSEIVLPFLMCSCICNLLYCSNHLDIVSHVFLK